MPGPALENVSIEKMFHKRDIAGTESFVVSVFSQNNQSNSKKLPSLDSSPVILGEPRLTSSLDIDERNSSRPGGQTELSPAESTI
jgi:hypothetical protein